MPLFSLFGTSLTFRVSRKLSATKWLLRNSFFFSPGLVQTEMTSGFGANAPWTPPELAPKLVVALASGRADGLAGRYIHAEHDDIDDLIARSDEIQRDDLNSIRLQR